eukprot:CAMPEP_0172469318 /NCGR_PEP_ID=MMETSP1065-20121228/63468_1 /TAXON_ID=265537 /ORGANISM="Amphiprora paludosa, Strain CCMP125" /LENGTH=65 /DNA_ID=CAMNT_0013226961 /DNA_START=80 /DNA_END=277 /DNA_ORIENTATION=+
MTIVQMFQDPEFWMEQAIAGSKLLMAISPLLIIGFILFTARESDEEEQEKRNSKAATVGKCCKTC